MRHVDPLNALYRLLREDSPAGAQARRRAVATGGVATFLLLLVAAIGFLELLLLAAAFAVVAAVAVAGVVGIRRHGATRGRGIATSAMRTAMKTSAKARRAVTEARRRLNAASSRTRATVEAWPTRKPVDRRREATRANAAGVELRREGRYLEAAERHRLALGLLRELGDLRAAALTLNNLALALDRAGDAAALDLFEEAATILGDLGEEQHEGQVIANLAQAFRRRGRDEQSDEVLETALEKLHPESPAYRKVESLRRAS